MKTKIYAAEALGSYLLVLGGCGCAILAADGGVNAIGPLGVSLAFGLSVMLAAFTFGSVSGGHFNPAVTFGLMLAGRFPRARVPGYVAAQVVGTVLAALTLYAVASGRADFTLAKGFAANGYGAHSPGGFGMGAAFLMEVVSTAVFLAVILFATRGAASAAAPYVIGAALTLIHLILIPVTNASVNPARSTSQALIVGDWALQQLWLFWSAPLAGAALGVVLYKLVFADSKLK